MQTRLFVPSRLLACATPAWASVASDGCLAGEPDACAEAAEEAEAQGRTGLAAHDREQEAALRAPAPLEAEARPPPPDPAVVTRAWRLGLRGVVEGGMHWYGFGIVGGAGLVVTRPSPVVDLRFALHAVGGGAWYGTARLALTADFDVLVMGARRYGGGLGARLGVGLGSFEGWRSFGWAPVFIGAARVVPIIVRLGERRDFELSLEATMNFFSLLVFRGLVPLGGRLAPDLPLLMPTLPRRTSLVRTRPVAQEARAGPSPSKPGPGANARRGGSGGGSSSPARSSTSARRSPSSSA